MKLIKENVLKTLKNIGKYVVTALIVISSFFIGTFFEEWHNLKDQETIEKNKVVERADVSLAVDENNNLIVIDNYTGDYVVYTDSIGISIFDLYAKNLWALHNKKE